MDKIYKKYKKSGAYYRKLKKTREKYEVALKNLFSGTNNENHSEFHPASTVSECITERSQLVVETETMAQACK